MRHIRRFFPVEVLRVHVQGMVRLVPEQTRMILLVPALGFDPVCLETGVPDGPSLTDVTEDAVLVLSDYAKQRKTETVDCEAIGSAVFGAAKSGYI